MNNSTDNKPTLKAPDDSLTAKTTTQKSKDELNLNANTHFDEFVSPQPFPHQQLPKQTPQPQSSHQISSTKSSNQYHNQTGYQQRVLSPEQEEALIRYNHLSYVLYLLSFFTAGLTWIIPIFMNYYKRQEAEGTWLETHFDWQIKTFWYSIIMGVICVFLIFFGVGGLGFGALLESGNLAIGSSLLFVLAGFIFLVTVLWHLYRIVRGWIALSDKKAV